jgi:hypothetical protein
VACATDGDADNRRREQRTRFLQAPPASWAAAPPPGAPFFTFVCGADHRQKQAAMR